MFKIIEDLALADALWQAGVLYFQARMHGLREECWYLDESENPLCAPSKYYPEEYAYAIRIEA